MSKKFMHFVPSVGLPVQRVSAEASRRSEVAVATGQSDEMLQLFAGIHKSKRFTVDAAHQLFAGLKRKK